MKYSQRALSARAFWQSSGGSLRASRILEPAMSVPEYLVSNSKQPPAPTPSPPDPRGCL